MISLPAWFPPLCSDLDCKQPHRIGPQGQMHEGQLYTQIVKRTANERGKINLHVKAYYCFTPEKSAQLKERLLTMHRRPKDQNLKEAEEFSRDFYFSNEDLSKTSEGGLQKLIHERVFSTLQLLKGIE